MKCSWAQIQIQIESEKQVANAQRGGNHLRTEIRSNWIFSSGAYGLSYAPWYERAKGKPAPKQK